MVSLAVDSFDDVDIYSAINGAIYPLTSSVNNITQIFLDAMGCSLAIFRELFSMVHAGSVDLWYRQRREIGFIYKPEPFNYYNLNPTKLTETQAKATKISIAIFLHGYGGTQAAALQIAPQFQQAGIPLHTRNFTYENSDELTKMINELANGLYKGKELNITLIGHSRGGAEAAHFAYVSNPNNPNRNENVTIDKVITIASRLADVPTTWRSTSEDVVKLAREINEAVKNGSGPQLYNLAAEWDWKVPFDATYIQRDPNYSFVAKNWSHLSILYNSEAMAKVLEWTQVTKVPVSFFQSILKAA